MNIIDAKVEVLITEEEAKAIIRKIERCGRVCYKSESRITDDSAGPFVQSIIKRGHLSVIEHDVVTAICVCDRGVSHEIVRHRIGSYSQESTRYVNYKTGVTYIDPVDFSLDNDDLQLLEIIEEHYKKCIEEKKRTPQQARYFLPNGLKTEIAITYNLREWRHFFDMRCDKAAHPQMREVAILLLQNMRNYFPSIFDDYVINFDNNTATSKTWLM
jgi:thymidylate synthase (FAD)